MLFFLEYYLCLFTEIRAEGNVEAHMHVSFAMMHWKEKKGNRKKTYLAVSRHKPILLSGLQC